MFLFWDDREQIGLKTGKLSTEKYYLILDRNYAGKTQRNVEYQVFKDFTPYCRFPLMSSFTLSPHIIYNKDIHLIDNKFFNIDNKISELEQKIKRLEKGNNK